MKILQKTILTNIFILLFISIASAQSGQDWINAMDREGYGQGFYHGFLSGWISGKREAGINVREMIKDDQLKLMRHPEYGFGFNLHYLDGITYFCLADKITRGQTHRIVEQYIEKNPQDWHKSLTLLFYFAIYESKVAECEASDYRLDKIYPEFAKPEFAK